MDITGDRRQLLEKLRELGFDSPDVQLTASGHDFIASFHMMTRLADSEALLREAIAAVHTAVHRGVRDEQLTEAVVDIAKRAGLWPLDPLTEAHP